MAGLPDRVSRYAAQQALWSPATSVVAAVSGGSDSVAMLFVLVELAARGELALAGVAHLNHRLRGAAADEDAAFCAALAARLGLPIHPGSADVAALAARDRQSIEVAGRRARARFLEEARVACAAEAIALAHTRDDQAETLLLRLVRGAGTRGLGAMAPQSGRRVRPVLDCARAELRQFLIDRGEAWREDASNDDLDNPRNRLRHDVLPRLADLNPGAPVALARAAAILRADAACLDALAAEAARGALAVTASRVLVRAAALAELPEALARRVALIALETAVPGRSYGLDEADALRRAARQRVAIDLPGVRMEPSGLDVVLQRRTRDRNGSPAFRVELPVPGTAHHPGGGWSIEAAGPEPRRAALPADGTSVEVDAGILTAPLVVRRREPGDRLQPAGLRGRKKVQDLFVDRKVPRDERDRVPLVTDASGAIVWVAGHALAEPFRVTSRTKAVVVLTLRRF